MDGNIYLMLGNINQNHKWATDRLLPSARTSGERIMVASLAEAGAHVCICVHKKQSQCSIFIASNRIESMP